MQLAYREPYVDVHRQGCIRLASQQHAFSAHRAIGSDLKYVLQADQLKRSQ